MVDVSSDCLSGEKKGEHLSTAYGAGHADNVQAENKMIFGTMTWEIRDVNAGDSIIKYLIILDFDFM